jgi:hypothetical protein
MIALYLLGPFIGILGHVILAKFGEDFVSKGRENLEESLSVFFLL